jgi:hypothetical protein
MKTLINFLLAFIARLSISFLGAALFVIGLILSSKKSKYLLNVAISYDQLGNVLGGPLFNLILKKQGGRPFGDSDETISYVLGKNKRINKLTRLGTWIADGLNKIDPNHVEKAKS